MSTTVKDKPAATAPTNGKNGDDAAPAPTWTVQDSADLYGIERWGQEYFSVNDEGHIVVHPTRQAERGLDLKQLVDELQQRDLAAPLLIRFNDLISHRAREIHGVFTRAMADCEYKGQYCCVYPIKVNQQRHVVEQVLDAGRQYNFGLEAGSKPELLAVMALVKDDTTPIICNGFKDDEFIEAVILAAKIGKNIIPDVQ